MQFCTPTPDLKLQLHQHFFDRSSVARKPGRFGEFRDIEVLAALEELAQHVLELVRAVISHVNNRTCSVGDLVWNT